MIRFSLIVFALSCVAMSGGNCVPQPAGVDVESLDAQLEAILGRLPIESLAARRINDGSGAEIEALFGVEYERGYTAYIVGNAEAIESCLLVDGQGALVQQELAASGSRVMRFVTGDTIIATVDGDGLLMSIISPATIPESVFTLRIDAAGEATLLTQASSVGAVASATYGAPSIAASPATRSLGLVEPETCAAIAQLLDEASSTVCGTLSTGELMTSGFAKACEAVSEFLENIENDELINADALEIVQSAVSFTCRGGEIILSRGRYFTRLSPIDWFCTVLQVSQEIATLSTGRSLGEVVCDFLQSQCPSGQVPDASGNCVTVEPPATVPVPTLPTPSTTPGPPPPPVVPPVQVPVPCGDGSQYDELSGRCRCPDGSEPDPQLGCPCGEDRHRNLVTGECDECASGSFLRIETCELPPDCCTTCFEAQSELDGMLASLSLKAALLIQAQSQCTLLGTGCDQIGALQDAYARDSAAMSRLAEQMAAAGCFGTLQVPSP